MQFTVYGLLRLSVNRLTSARWNIMSGRAKTQKVLLLLLLYTAPNFEETARTGPKLFETVM